MSVKSANDRRGDARPMCKYGTDCYRKNPAHFEEYRHPGKVLSLSYKNTEYAQFVCCDL